MKAISKCPMCGHTQPNDLPEGYSVILCDPDEGGCDEYYVGKVSNTVTCTTMKIMKQVGSNLNPVQYNVNEGREAVMQPKVWIVNSAGHDFKAAESFGDEMISLTVGRVNIFNVERLTQEFRAKMENFSKDDWLLLSGNTVINVIAVMVALAKHKEVKLLIFDVVRKQYVPREISVENF